jgi:hypothetical protein
VNRGGQMKCNVVAGVLAACTLAFAAGCNVIGFFGSPTSHEKAVAAEYPLRGTQSRIAVYVDEARSGSIPVELRRRLDTAVRTFLVRKVRVKEEYLVAPIEYTPGRLAEYSRMSPAEVGRRAGADLVLYVRIESYDLMQMHSEGYFNGEIVTRSVLMDAASHEVVWPSGNDVKLARIRFELETGGREAALDRLAGAAAHCVTRYFYDCPADQFRAGDEQKEYDQMHWQ